MNANFSIRLEPSAPAIPFDAIAKGTAGVSGTCVVLFLAYDVMLKVCQVGEPVLGGASVARGTLELALLAVYLVRRSSFVGAVLWTGYLGASVAAHPALLPLVVATLLWLPLVLVTRRGTGRPTVRA